jgi:hypothetical protein
MITKFNDFTLSLTSHPPSHLAKSISCPLCGEEITAQAGINTKNPKKQLRTEIVNHFESNHADHPDGKNALLPFFEHPTGKAIQNAYDRMDNMRDLLEIR